ncbi:hypothetical protein DFH94DRAFT_439548 [Russula ochroleuca]|jgi:hypothetical protein|uniref:Uncharacterized protein n=1 Tax=Russula ochroleuca TaxID=152965 RepID=A0A9P5MXG7_9AGAM|nr:hypothetical protein DFH94DRAFT_439548 [Russula ochroleuca]
MRIRVLVASTSALHATLLRADFKLQLQHVASVETSTHTHSPSLSFVRFRWLVALTDDFPPPQTPPLHSHAVRTRQVPLQHVKNESWQIEPGRFGADCSLGWVQPPLWIENDITSPPLDPFPLVISSSFSFTDWSALKTHDHRRTDIARPYCATASTFQVYYASSSCNHVRVMRRFSRPSTIGTTSTLSALTLSHSPVDLSSLRSPIKPLSSPSENGG